MKPLLILIILNFVINIKHMNSQDSNIIQKGDTILIGYATNMKIGAGILTSDETLYYIENLASWNKMYYGKKVIVSGSLVLIKHKKSKNEGSITLQDIHFEGHCWIQKKIKNAIWRLYEE